MIGDQRSGHRERVFCKSSDVVHLEVACAAGRLARFSAQCSMELGSTQKIQIRAPSDKDNRDHQSPVNVSLHCKAGSMDAAISMQVVNVIRPVFGRVGAVERGNAQSQHTVLSSKGGPLEIITASRADIVFTADPAMLGPTFITPSVTLVDTQSDTRYALKVLRSTTSEILVRYLPFEEVCHNRSVCFFSTEIRNLPRNSSTRRRSSSLFGSVLCPREGSSYCFPGVTAAKTPNRSNRWHTVRYVRQCIGYSAPGAAECFATVDSAQKCAFGLGEACVRCPWGAQLCCFSGPLKDPLRMP